MARQKRTPVADKAEPEKTEEEVVVETTAPVVVEDAQVTEVTSGQKPAPEAESQETPETSAPAVTNTMVMVRNLRKTFFYQPETGLRIEGGKTRELRNDSWLVMQVAAGLLEVVT